MNQFQTLQPGDVIFNKDWGGETLARAILSVFENDYEPLNVIYFTSSSWNNEGNSEAIVARRSIAMKQSGMFLTAFDMEDGKYTVLEKF